MFLVDARTEVAAFSEAMEDRLAEFEEKGGWSEDDVYTLFDRMENNLNDLYEEVYKATHYADKALPDVLNTCADIANYVMMIADNLGALDDYKGDLPPESEIEPFEGIYDGDDVHPLDMVLDDEPPAEVEL